MHYIRSSEWFLTQPCLSKKHNWNKTCQIPRRRASHHAAVHPLTQLTRRARIRSVSSCSSPIPKVFNSFPLALFFSIELAKLNHRGDLMRNSSEVITEWKCNWIEGPLNVRRGIASITGSAAKRLVTPVWPPCCNGRQRNIAGNAYWSCRLKKAKRLLGSLRSHLASSPMWRAEMTLFVLSVPLADPRRSAIAIHDPVPPL